MFSSVMNRSIKGCFGTIFCNILVDKFSEAPYLLSRFAKVWLRVKIRKMANQYSRVEFDKELFCLVKLDTYYTTDDSGNIAMRSFTQDRIKATARDKRNGEIYDEATFEPDLLDV
ncbi:unnamed protein product [Rhizophagus irregularis]|nr:unnamed protein product [Rhizophagus irregularis]